MAAAFVGFFILFSALAVDMAYVYTQKEALQNAADASALAGANQLWRSDITTDEITESYIKEYVNLNSNDATVNETNSTSYPTQGNTGGINVKATYATPSTTEKTVTVELRRRMPTYFLKIFGFAGFPVEVTAKANNIKSNGSGTSSMFADDNPDNPFNYAFATSAENAQSIWLTSDYNYIKGNIRTNGRINAANYAGWTHNMIEGSIYSDVSDYENLWKNLGNNGQKFQYELEDYTSDTSMGPTKETTGQNKANAVLSQSTLDVSLSSSNKNTAAIQAYINNIIAMSAADREAAHIYYTTSKGAVSTWSNTITLSDGTSYNGLTISGMDSAYKHAYNVIIAYGDINADPQLAMSENTVLISLNGDIVIHNGVPFTGIAYAPNGSITINGSAEVKGSFVAGKKGNGLGAITVTTSGQKITFGTGTGGGTTTYKVSLIK